MTSLVLALGDLVVFESFAGAVCASEIPCNTGPIEKLKLKPKTAIDLFIQFVIALLRNSVAIFLSVRTLLEDVSSPSHSL